MALALKFRKGSDVLGFLDELAPIFGTRMEALQAIVQSTSAFRSWREKVDRCVVCKRWVAIKHDATLGWVTCEHTTRNPCGDRPYWIQCPGSMSIAQPCTLNSHELDSRLRAILHHVETLHPDLL